MTLATGASVVSDTAASGGKAVKMTTDGRLVTSMSLPAAATSLDVRLRSSFCSKTWPNARVAVDGVVVMAYTKIATSSWTVYSVSGLSLPAGTHTVAVALQNTIGAGSGRKCSPALYVDKLTMSGDTTPPAPTVSLSASPASVASGEASVLTWSSTNATSCSAGGAWSGAKPTAGSASTGLLTATSAYSLTCTGGGGSATASRTVSVVDTGSAVAPTGTSPYGRFVWGDEFNAPAGSQPDPAKWVIKNGKPWNNGLNSYTSRPVNVSMDGSGALDLTARRETYTGADGVTRDYTSGAVLTKDRYTFTYGHVEARIWVPAGRGFWSAFWTLHWPIGAEIDAMEILGQSASAFHTNIRNLKTDGTSNYWASATFGAASSLATGYHVYGMTWQPDRISWQLDGVEVRSVSPGDLPSDYKWGYSDPEWIILNLGVGGDWPLAPDSTTPFPSRMKVDWVRVYQ